MVLRQVEEILRTGRIERAQHLQNNPKNVALKELQAVWGVGETAARDLVRKGVMSVKDLRSVELPCTRKPVTAETASRVSIAR